MKFIAGIMPHDDVAAETLWKSIKREARYNINYQNDTNVKVKFEVVMDVDGDRADEDSVALTHSSLLAGILFKNGSFSQMSAADVLGTATIMEVRKSAGASLSERVWGHYVGLFFDPHSGDLTAVRDPTGGRVIYHARRSENQLDLFSNSLPALCRALCHGLRVDHKMIGLSLAYTNGLPTRRTGFEGISALFPGECLVLRAATGEVTSCLPWWKQIAVVSGDGGPDEIEFALHGAVSAWSSVSGRIALQLSGGLDSSGLLGALAKAGRTDQVRCLSYYRGGSVTDERRHAALAARSAGTKVTEIDTRGLSLSLDLANAYRWCPRPHWKLIDRELEEAFHAQASAADCQTYWLGYGGDTLFLTNPRSHLVRDALQAGFGRAARCATEVALFNEKSLWRVFREAISSKSDCQSFSDWVDSRKTPWNNSALEGRWDLDDNDFKLVDECFSCVRTIGQRSRLYDLYAEMWVTAEQHHYYTAEGMGYVRPLYSEPVIRAALNYPTYETVQFGLNRYPQRQIVARIMPTSIAERVTKGGADDHLFRAMFAAAPQIEERLLGGQLAAHGYISPGDVRIDRTNIASESWKNFRVLNYLASEVWLAGHMEMISA